ncbi:hypothetical protein SCHPADRAFT_602452 [Schizopora paradoxa]|uniref:Uncharacterized protein n=1 Tax=Schizopora paradoxa TaxID=27342 RepID=A0A0H2RB53_9AGAM|nr:hypothetical protein SCHPADRAFT_602452 [Schizopora paradoxa]
MRRSFSSRHLPRHREVGFDVSASTVRGHKFAIEPYASSSKGNTLFSIGFTLSMARKQRELVKFETWIRCLGRRHSSRSNDASLAAATERASQRGISFQALVRIQRSRLWQKVEESFRRGAESGDDDDESVFGVAQLCASLPSSLSSSSHHPSFLMSGLLPASSYRTQPPNRGLGMTRSPAPSPSRRCFPRCDISISIERASLAFLRYSRWRKVTECVDGTGKA